MIQPKQSCFYYNFIKRTWIAMNEGLQRGPLSRAVGLAAYWDFYVLGGESAQGVPTNYVSLVQIYVNNFFEALFNNSKSDINRCKKII